MDELKFNFSRKNGFIRRVSPFDTISLNKLFFDERCAFKAKYAGKTEEIDSFLSLIVFVTFSNGARIAAKSSNFGKSISFNEEHFL